MANETGPARPTRPGLDYVFSIEAHIAAPISSGPNADGERLHIAILGGSVSGPRLSGTVAPGGSDWPRIRPDGTTEISAKYTIIAGDGTPILVTNQGLRVSSADVLARLRAAESVPPDAYYFRSTPRFEAPDGPHAWLNDRMFVASLMPGGSQIRIDVYLVT